MNSLKIVVLAGGLSPEREVSLVSGSGVCRALRERGHRAVLADLYLGLEEPPAELESLFDAEDGRCPDAAIRVSAPDLEAVKRGRRDQGPSHIGPHVLELCALADVVFLALHGREGEDGRIQAALDLLGVPYTGSGYLASGIAMDKAVTKRMLDSAGLPTPPWWVLDYTKADIPRLARELPMPCVIKNTTGGSSLGVFLPENREELAEALAQVGAFGGQVIWEQRITGRELTAAVLGDRALPPVETFPAGKEFDYEAKYQKGAAREVCPAELTPDQTEAVEKLALQVHQALGLEVYSRMDMILDGAGQLWCLEANSLPGMTPTSFVPREAREAGMSYGELCEEIVRLSLDVKRRED